MIAVAITLVHNKSDKENKKQLDALLPLIEKHTQDYEEEVQDRTYTDVEEDYIDVNDRPGKRIVRQEVLGKPYTATFQSHYYTLQGLPDYEVKFYQIIPFGVTPPSNLDQIDSHKVWYGEGDSDKQGDHPRFFNWAVKRGTDYGAEIVLYMDDVKKLSIDDLAIELNTLADPDVKTEFIKNASGKQINIKALLEKGQISESKTVAEGVEKYKEEVKNG